MRRDGCVKECDTESGNRDRRENRLVHLRARAPFISEASCRQGELWLFNQWTSRVNPVTENAYRIVQCVIVPGPPYAI